MILNVAKMRRVFNRVTIVQADTTATVIKDGRAKN
jgi:hypothetical protein